MYEYRDGSEEGGEVGGRGNNRDHTVKMEGKEEFEDILKVKVDFLNGRCK